MQLQRLIGDLEAGVGRQALGHRAPFGLFRVAGVDGPGAAQHHQAGRLQIGRHVRQLELGVLELADGLAELLAGRDVVLRRLQRQTGPAQRAGGDVQAPAVQAGHGVFEARAFLAHQIGDRHAAVVEADHGGRLGVPAHLLLIGAEGKAGRSRLDHQGRNALRPLAAGADHDDIDVRRPCARDEGLGAVQHIVVAVAHRRRPQRRRVRTRARLGQAVAGDLLHPDQRRHETRPQLVRAEAVDHPRRHVVDRDEGRRRHVAARQLLEDQRRLDPAQAHAAVFLARIDAGEAHLGGGLQHIDREMLVLVPAGRVRRQFGLGEGAGGVLNGALVVGEGEVHGSSRVWSAL
ncbi:hypothetical protein D3C80_1072090 [compost metagenome]